MPDVITALAIFCLWTLVALLLGLFLGKVISLGERPADELEPRRRARSRAESNGIHDVGRAS